MFLSLGETWAGSYDGYITHSPYSGDFANSVSGNTQHSFNFTYILDLYDDKYNLSPRHLFHNVKASSSSSATDLDKFNGYVMFMDTEREK